MTWTYYYRADLDDRYKVSNVIRLRVDPDGTWQTLEADGVWRSGEGTEQVLKTEVPGVTIPEVSIVTMAQVLWAATDGGRFAELPAEPRLASYEPDWQYCVLRPIDVDTRTTRDMVFSESAGIDFSEIWFGRYNRNHYDKTNFQELRHVDGAWVDSELRFILFAKGDGRDELLDLPADAVGRLIDRAMAHGRPARRPTEPPAG